MGSEAAEWVRALLPAVIIASSVYFASRSYQDNRRKTAYEFYDKFADRMFVIRQLQISNPDIPTIWEGGPEGIALKDTPAQHFYFAKMLFQANEAIFLALSDPQIQTDATKMDLYGWEENFRTDLSSPIFARIWRNFPHVRSSYSREFQAKVDEILNKLHPQGELKA